MGAMWLCQPTDLDVARYIGRILGEIGFDCFDSEGFLLVEEKLQ